MRITAERVAQLHAEQGSSFVLPVVFRVGLLEITDGDPAVRLQHWGLDGRYQRVPLTIENVWNWLCQRYPERIFDTTGITVPDFPPLPPMWCPSCAAGEPCWLHDPGEL